jgi:glycosyltransferase involved in cell wall biosynthesis
MPDHPGPSQTMPPTKADPANPRPHVLHVFQPDTGGVPGYVANLTYGLLDRGWRVTLAGPASAQTPREAAAAGAELIPLDLPRGAHPRHDLAAIATLSRAIRRRGVDVVHAHSSKAGVVATWAARLNRRPCVYTPHGWSFQMSGHPLKQAFYARVERLHSRRGRNLTLVVSRAERTSALERHVCPPHDIEVVHTGLRPHPANVDRQSARGQLGLPQDAFVAVWVGRAGAQKRPQDLPALQKRLAGVATVLAIGNGLEGTEVAADLVAAGGIVAPPDLPPATGYAAADLLVHTAEWEGLPLVVLEAMQSRLPVVAYAVGGVEEQVRHGETGYLGRPRDVETLAGYVQELAQDGAICERFGRAAAARLESDFDFDQMVERIEHLYRRVRADRDG